MTLRTFLVLFGALLIVRLPSLVQPMGADQGLYAYVGERILAGGLPYRDAWDQKPPAIHFTYALMRALHHGDASVAAADIVAAALTAWFLFRIGSRLAPGAAGPAAALIFLLLSNPAFTRIGGVRLRAQCETFIAVLVSGAYLQMVRRRDGGGARGVYAAGLLLGAAFTFKYNAGIYVGAAVVFSCLWRRVGVRDWPRLVAGFGVPLAVLLAAFAVAGTLRPLYDATITYNVQYSGETYAGPLDVVRYLVTFPIDRARVDALWTVGGAGCLVLLAAGLRDRSLLVAPVWVAVACVSIAVNGSRGLPQYFVQANPALALAAGLGGATAWNRARGAFGRRAIWVGTTAAALVAVGVWRVNQFPKLVEQTLFDAKYAAGRIERATYLARYADERKYSALAAAELAEYLRMHSAATDPVYVFGFTCAAYVNAGRASASRFFWSRPVIAGFDPGHDGYGPDGLLGELTRNPPAVVALQIRDWAPDVEDSARFFMASPKLAGWLNANYAPDHGPDGFDVWLRKAAVP
jgi:4-amino-4-deoxy-L-arabinose transferase-like glycosyltransferase